jgi:hypothetical protein
MVPVILHTANLATASAVRSPNGVALGLRGDDLLLEAGQQQLPFGQGQPQVGDLTKIIGPVDLQDVSALFLIVSPDFHQSHNPSHAPTPDQRSDTKLTLRRLHPQSPGSPRDVTASLPEELSVVGALLHAPDGSKLVAMVLCHCGSVNEGERAIQPIKRFGAPVMDTIGPMTYCDVNTMLDDGYPKGALNYWKSSFLAGLSDDAIHAMIDCFGSCPTPMGKLILEHFHGAVSRVGVSDTAFPHRRDGYNALVLAEWTDPKENDACIAWLETLTTLSCRSWDPAGT